MALLESNSWIVEQHKFTDKNSREEFIKTLKNVEITKIHRRCEISNNLKIYSVLFSRDIH